MPRVSPVNSVQHVAQLRRRDRNRPVRRRRPNESAMFQSLRVKRHADPIMPDDLDQPASGSPKDVQIASVRVPTQRFLDLQRQAVHALAHVGSADRQPHSNARGNRDHRRDNAFTTAAASSAGIELGIRTMILPANSISIAGSP